MRQTNLLQQQNNQSLHESVISVIPEILDEMFEEAKGRLPFDPIINEAFGEDWGYDQVEYYKLPNGEELQGNRIYATNVFDEETIRGNLELFKEISFTSNGQFLVFFAVYENKYIDAFEETNTTLHRVLAEDQRLSLKETKFVLNEIANDLNRFPLF